MMRNPILIADALEERYAASALRNAETLADLGEAWCWADSFSGAARIRLDAIYCDRLLSMSEHQRAIPRGRIILCLAMLAWVPVLAIAGLIVMALS